jgi:hypothetical protein
MVIDDHAAKAAEAGLFALEQIGGHRPPSSVGRQNRRWAGEEKQGAQVFYHGRLQRIRLSLNV